MSESVPQGWFGGAEHSIRARSRKGNRAASPGFASRRASWGKRWRKLTLV